MKEIDLTDPKWGLPLDELGQASCGFTVVELETLFEQRLYVPELAHERFKLNAQMILKMLGIKDPTQLHRRRLADWLRKNGFSQYKRDRYWSVGLKYSQDGAKQLRFV